MPGEAGRPHGMARFGCKDGGELGALPVHRVARIMGSGGRPSPPADSDGDFNNG